VGVLLPSYAFRGWYSYGQAAPSLDRYFLPLLPFAVCLALWALARSRRGFAPVAWILVVAMGVFSAVGTRDSIHFQRAAWDLGWWANEQGVDNTRLSAGFSWDAYHLWEYSATNGIPPQAPEPRPWWLEYFVTGTDASYVVAAAPLPDHEVVHEQEYSSWLQDGRTVMYLQRRDDVPGPP
jgi:hypothetical protein